jgi:hypothetical protein
MTLPAAVSSFVPFRLKAAETVPVQWLGIGSASNAPEAMSQRTNWPAPIPRTSDPPGLKAPFQNSEKELPSVLPIQQNPTRIHRSRTSAEASRHPIIGCHYEGDSEMRTIESQKGRMGQPHEQDFHNPPASLNSSRQEIL